MADTQPENGEGIPRTPPRPPYSPVTPVMSQATLFPLPTATGAIPPLSPTPAYTGENRDRQANATAIPASFIPEPTPVPISESDNPDAIALRSAISVLQFQKQQAVRDIRELDRIKQAATADPEGFVKELTAGKLASKEGDIFNPTCPESDKSEGDRDEDMQEDDAESRDSQVGGADMNGAKFGKIPKPQNVVRMPPINWAKYHIVGEPLDKLHEEQRARPSPGEPRTDLHASRAPEHFVAAPYRPFVDKLDPPMRTRSSNKTRK